MFQKAEVDGYSCLPETLYTITVFSSAYHTFEILAFIFQCARYLYKSKRMKTGQLMVEVKQKPRVLLIMQMPLGACYKVIAEMRLCEKLASE